MAKQGVIISQVNFEETGVLFVPQAYWGLYVVTDKKFKVLFYDYDGNHLATSAEQDIIDNGSAWVQPTIAKIDGTGQVKYIMVSSDTTSNMDVPAWMPSVEFLATFKNTLQAGTVTESAASTQIAIYRKEGTKLFPLKVCSFDATGLSDHALRSNRESSYLLFYIIDGKYSTAIESSPICKKFKQYTLTEAEEQSDGTYLAIKTWRFANNIEASAVGNNNTPSTLGNFTQYPMWQPSAQSPKSGTLSALLGRFSQGQYIEETADDMDELYAISHSTNTFFLKDMKGNLMMVKPNGAISQSINNKSGKMEVTVSVPWVEVGDASKATILSF